MVHSNFHSLYRYFQLYLTWIFLIYYFYDVSYPLPFLLIQTRGLQENAYGDAASNASCLFGAEHSVLQIPFNANLTPNCEIHIKYEDLRMRVADY